MKDVSKSTTRAVRGLTVFLTVSALVLMLGLFLAVGIWQMISAEPAWDTFSITRPEGTYYYTVSGDTATIVDASVEGDITIPETVNGYTVSALGDSAFFGLPELTSVVVPGCVKTVGSSCFGNCIQLESAIFRDGVEEIGNSAFCCYVHTVDEVDHEVEYTSTLRHLTLPDSIVAIGERAFEETRISGELILPVNLKRMGQGAFAYTNLQCVTIPAGFQYSDAIVFSGLNDVEFTVNTDADAYVVQDNFLLGRHQTVAALYLAQQAVTAAAVPDTVSVIGHGCFADTDITGVSLPSTLREIRAQAFSGCTGLLQVTIPNGVHTVGNAAFSVCRTLAQIALPNTVTVVGDGAFSYCDRLTDVTLFAPSVSLGASAFSGCRALIRVNFVGKDVRIGARAFGSCTALRELVLPGGQVYLGSHLFANTGIKTVVLNSDNVTVADDLYPTEELYYPYTACNIETVVIGKDVTRLNEALYLAATVKRIVVDKQNASFVVDGPALYSKDRSRLIRFFGLPGSYYDTMDSFSVPDGVKIIGDKAFQGARVSRVVLNAQLETIGEKAFYRSHITGAFELSSSVKTIGYRAFGYAGIRHFGIQSTSLTKLSSNMFHGCSALTDVYYVGVREAFDAFSTRTDGSYFAKARVHYATDVQHHPFTETVEQKAGVNKEGCYRYTCPCGQSYTLPIWQVGSVEIGYHTVDKHFFSHVYATRAHAVPQELTHGVDYTYTVSSPEAGVLAFEITFIGDRYEGGTTVEQAIYLPPVTSLAVTETTSDGATMTWQGVEPADGYKILRYDADVSRWETIASTTALSYTASALAGDTTYQYQVVAYLNVDGICELVGNNGVSVSVTL